ncbi:MAG TPA: polysaccharide biosynthesis tyrosine autokinase [Tepidisphaeraceae bacterium]|jgi:capsular exopolysaccharide synthesis family protein
MSNGAGQEGLLLVLWRQRYVIGGCTLACLLLATIFLAFATRMYTSTARMKITPAGSHMTGQTQTITDSTAGNYLYTEQQLIQSPAVLSLALQMPDVKPLVAGQPHPILFLQKYLDVEVGKRDTILSVSFSSPDSQAAATIANGIVKAYTAYQIKPKPADTAELDRLADERGKLETSIGEKSRQMLALEQRYGVLTQAGTQGSLAERQLTLLSQELATAHLDTLKAQAEHQEASTAARAMGVSAADVDPADTLPLSGEQQTQIRSEILLYQARLDDLRTHYMSDHPSVKAVERKIAQLRGVYARAVEQQYRICQLREHDLQINLDAQQKQAIEVSAAAAQYMRLQADVDAARKIEEQIDNRRRDVELARDLGMLNIDPYDPATPQLKPSEPKRSVVLGVGLLLGLVLGSGVGFLHDWFDDRFRTIAEMRAATGLPVLGIVPQIPDALGPSIVGQQALLEPMSPVAEACRMIRTAMHFGAAKHHRRTLLITSPSSGEGKSTLASNLAITLAQSGRRVLLIDADLRLPMQHKIFGAANETGLSTILQGGATLEGAVEATEVNGLELLPAGPEAHNPAEMLNSPVFTELLDMVYDRYDHVVIDSAPVVGLADSRIIAASCDATVLVLRAGQSTRRVSDVARGGLSSVGAQVVGIVVNDATEGLQKNYPYIAPRHRRPREIAAENPTAARALIHEQE